MTQVTRNDIIDTRTNHIKLARFRTFWKKFCHCSVVSIASVFTWRKKNQSGSSAPHQEQNVLKKILAAPLICNTELAIYLAYTILSKHILDLTALHRLAVETSAVGSKRSLFT
jgi:hypothetical protein